MKLFRLHVPAVLFTTSIQGRSLIANHEQHLRAVAFLRKGGVPHKELRWWFDNYPSDSILLPQLWLDTAHDVAWTSGADYLVLLDEYRNASRHNLRQYPAVDEPMGRLVASQDYRNEQQGYVYDPLTGTHYYLEVDNVQ